MFVFLDVSSAMSDPVVVRTAKDIAQAARPGQTLILADVDEMHLPDLADLAVPFTLEPPESDELKDIVTQALAGLDARKIPVTLDDGQRAQLVDAGISTRAPWPRSVRARPRRCSRTAPWSSWTRT